MRAARIASKTRGDGGYGFSLVLSLMILAVARLLAGGVAGHRADVGRIPGMTRWVP